MTMKPTLLLILSAALLCAADAPKPTAGPKPIPAERKEIISQAIIRLQSLELRAQQIRLANPQLVAAEAAAEQAAQDYERMIEALRKEFSAEGCTLAVDKSWQCPASRAATIPPVPPGMAGETTTTTTRRSK